MHNQPKYKIEYTKNSEQSELLLNVDFLGNNYPNTELVKDVYSQLEKLKEEKIYEGIDLVKIDGRISVPLAYVFANKLQNNVKYVAIKYPQTHQFIVANGQVNQFSLGDIILPKTNEAFTANLYKDTLNINCKLGVVNGQQLIKEAARLIEQLIQDTRLKPGKLLKINGKSAIIVSFMIAHKLANIYQNIAVWDPKLNAYIVTVKNRSGQYEIGHLIKSDVAKTPNQKKIVICGHANRGKTVLRDCLNRILNQYMSNNDYFIISGCPDGDGAWYNECYTNNPNEAKKLKDQYKAAFTEKFAQNKAQEIQPINTPLLLFDVGGKISDDNQLTDQNKTIMSQATHALIVGSNEDEIAPWRKGCQSLKLTVIAEVTSKTGEGEDIFNINHQLCIATIHNLVRGGQIPQGVHRLAQFLAQGIPNNI